MQKMALDQIYKHIKRNSKYWIVFTGDSITSCEWVHPNWRNIVIFVLHREMRKYLKGDWKTAEWSIKGFNFAYDGSTTKDILEKIDKVLIVKPQLVIGLMGGNDPGFGVSVDESVISIKKISENVIRNDSQLVWCSSTPAAKGAKINLDYEPYSTAFMQIPDDKNFKKIDMFNIYQKFSTEKFFTFTYEENKALGRKDGDQDPEHPNQLGNAYIAKVILEEVFDLNFDPEKYIRETLEGKKNPGY